jgi:hypothetical protein
VADERRFLTLVRRLDGCSDAEEPVDCSSELEPRENSDESLRLDFFLSGMVSM